jgi:hypothetical protein
MQRYYKSQRIYLVATRFVKANGPAVEGVNVGGVSPSGSSPGTLATNLSRRTSRHGAIFANPGEAQNCPGCRICPEPKSRLWQMSENLFVKMKLSRWRAKIVTSLLPQPSVLVQVALIVDLAGSIIGSGC